MRVSKASPKLFLACATGQHFKEATLVGRKAGKGQQDFMTWTFSDVLGSSLQTGDSAGSDHPLDNVSLNVSKAQISYNAQKADGSLDTPITAGFDTKTNKKS
jgi:type VI secretion system secreted protein Hcp